jgi:peptidylamidoglycolate lyase
MMNRYTVLGIFVVTGILVASWLVMRQISSPPAFGDQYQVILSWPHLPEGMATGQVAGVDVDEQGRVVIFRRADKVWNSATFDPDVIPVPTVLVVDGENGELLAAWGENQFVMPHGLTVDGEGYIWLTDVGLHQVFKFDADGNLLLTVGEAGVPGTDETHFNRPTDVAVAADGSFYVSDGYVNSRVVKFAGDGRYLLSWGTHGTAPGAFDVPHSIALDHQGRLYVADRGNGRIQIFEADGRYLDTWQDRRGLGRPWAIRIGSDGAIYVVDGGDQQTWLPDRARILQLSPDGEVVGSFGAFGTEPGQFIWPHAIGIADDGHVYVGEVSTGMRIQKFEPVQE